MLAAGLFFIPNNSINSSVVSLNMVNTKLKEYGMNDLNSILVEGNLARDPVMSVTPNGTSVCNFVVASHHLFKRQQEQRKDTSFFDVEAWARLGENCGEYLRKGRGVRVIGRLKQDRWKDGEGHPKSRVKIIAEHVEFKPGKKKENDQAFGEAGDGATDPAGIDLDGSGDGTAGEAVAEDAQKDDEVLSIV